MEFDAKAKVDAFFHLYNSVQKKVFFIKIQVGEIKPRVTE